MRYDDDMIHELSENVFSWKGLRIHTVRVSDDYIRGSIPMHRHAADSLELHVILGGRGSVRTPAGTFPLQAGSFFLTHGEAEHEQRSDADDPMRELCFYATYETGRAKTDALSALAHPFRVAAANEDILLCARQAAKELSAAKEGFEDALGSLFRLILIYAARTKGAARSDHAPAMGVETQSDFGGGVSVGYQPNGQIFSYGYIKGCCDALKIPLE